jgi:putative endonuclease
MWEVYGIMRHHQAIGQSGEALACQYLAENGYLILEKNWRFGRYEVDIIACKADKLHIIEVKTRTSDRFGHPEENVSKSKLEFLAKAAEAYTTAHPNWMKLQFDVIAILLKKNSSTEILLLEDIYW